MLLPLISIHTIFGCFNKKGGWLFILFLFSMNCFAQKETNLFMLLEREHDNIGITADQLLQTKISNSYTSCDGLTVIYLQQIYQGLPIFNSIKVVAFKGSKLVSNFGNYINCVDDLIHQNSMIEILPEEAVNTACRHLSIIPKNKLQRLSQVGNKVTFNICEYVYSNITAELCWLPISDNEIRLVWQIELMPVNTADHLLIRVDAENNFVVDMNNYTVYESINNNNKKSSELTYRPSLNEAKDIPNNIINSVNYRVIPFPFESPNHFYDTTQLVNNPWLKSVGNATSLQWHFNGLDFFDSTKGNNVWAQEDRDNNNLTIGKSAKANSALLDLIFDFKPDSSGVLSYNNQQFSITNLFYWNNIMHDISYLYGFDEVSGNFQDNNLSRGGLQNDFVMADAQDAGGFNNANFSTPVDGVKPRMQMYLFNNLNSIRDADLDNGIIIHEYAHGISNRLTGGPNNSSCLINAEQPGEGWSDYFSLMMTTDWSTSSISDGSLPRPLGTYALSQSITGKGIRKYPYSTDMQINPWTYAMMTDFAGDPHKNGEIWCSALWDMTWELIRIEGINKNIFNPILKGGNSIALKLVMEGMRLQTCRPGFIDARNAILKADSILFNAKYSCAIWSAFARRGLGVKASQGLSNNTKDQVADFSNNIGAGFLITQSVDEQIESGFITYTNTVKASLCFDIANFLICDTLPKNVEYISGGIYDSIWRVVRFIVNVSAGETQLYTFKVKVKPGAFFNDLFLLNDSFTTSSIPLVWKNNSSTSNNWVLSSEENHTPAYSLLSKNANYISDQNLSLIRPLRLSKYSKNIFSFHFLINSETNWDGGVVEISNNNGVTWNDIGYLFLQNGYNGKLNISANPLAGRKAFTGNNGVFQHSLIDLTSFAGQTINIRFRFGSDENYAYKGWFIDDVQLISSPIIIMHVGLYDSVNSLNSYLNLSTRVIKSQDCFTGQIINQPINLTICEGQSDSISILATGSSLTYQWQISKDSGITFSNLIGKNNSTLYFNNVTDSLNTGFYRCLIQGECTFDLISDYCIVQVLKLPIFDQSLHFFRCGPGALTLSIHTDINEVVDWYEAEFSNTILATSNQYITPMLFSNTTYWVSKRNVTTGCSLVQRYPAIITLQDLPNPPIVQNTSRCGPGSVIIAATVPNDCTVNWYDSSINGLLIDTGLMLYTSVLSFDKELFVESVSFAGCSSSIRSCVKVKINELPAKIKSVSGATKCSNNTALISAVPMNGMSVVWYADSMANTLLRMGATSMLDKYQTPLLSNTTTYWVANYNIVTNCISNEKVPVTVIINQKPILPIVNSVSRCGAGKIYFNLATPTNSFEKYAWYNSVIGVNLISSSSRFTTPILTTTKMYYIELKNSSTGCVSSREQISAIINPIPAMPTVLGSSRCGKGQITLKANSLNGNVTDWFSSISGGVCIVRNMDSLNINYLSSTKSYFVTSRDTLTSCVSSKRAKVSAIIVPVLQAPKNIAFPGNICSIVNSNESVYLSCSNVANALSYTWFLPAGAMIDRGMNTNIIKAHFLPIGINDSIYASANNSCLGNKKGLKLFTSNCYKNSNRILSTKENNLNLSRIKVFPNPSNNNFKVEINNGYTDLVFIKIYNLQGVLIESDTKRDFKSISIGSKLSPGIYILQVQQDQIFVRKKIIKL